MNVLEFNITCPNLLLHLFVLLLLFFFFKVKATSDMRDDFLSEMKLMIELGSHPNILQILGCCTLEEPYYLLTEFMEYGDLLHFLWKCREVRMHGRVGTFLNHLFALPSYIYIFFGPKRR